MLNLILLIGMLIGSHSAEIPLRPALNLPAETHVNVAYGSDPKQTLDIYLPAGRDTVQTKLMILVHGGSWTRGDKAEFTQYIAELQKRLPEYAFANINYRLFDKGENRFPAQENDIEAAFNFLMNRRTEYGYSKQVVLMGASAGAHLAMLQGYKHANAVKPLAIISFFGPTDLEHLYNHPSLPVVPFLLAGITGSTPEADPELYKSYSPVHFVTSQSPPTLLLHGGADNLVPPAQAEMMKKKLKAAGVKHDLIVYPQAGHGWRGRMLEDSFNKIKSFLKSNAG